MGKAYTPLLQAVAYNADDEWKVDPFVVAEDVEAVIGVLQDGLNDPHPLKERCMRAALIALDHMHKKLEQAKQNAPF